MILVTIKERDVSPSKINIGISGETNVETIQFTVDRFYNRLDLSEATPHIIFVSPDNTTMIYSPDEIVVCPSTVKLRWVIGSQVTAVKGTAHYQVAFVKEEPTTRLADPTSYVFMSKSAIMVILGSLLGDGSNVITPNSPEWIALMKLLTDSADFVTDIQVDTEANNLTYKQYDGRETTLPLPTFDSEGIETDIDQIKDDLTAHTSNTVIHTTQGEKNKLEAVVDDASNLRTDLDDHVSNEDVHWTPYLHNEWQAMENKQTEMEGVLYPHVANNSIHVTQEQKDRWEASSGDNFDDLKDQVDTNTTNISGLRTDLDEHRNNDSIHVTQEDKDRWDNAAGEIVGDLAEKLEEIDNNIEELQTGLEEHVTNDDIHVTALQKENWTEVYHQGEIYEEDQRVATIPGLESYDDMVDRPYWIRPTTLGNPDFELITEYPYIENISIDDSGWAYNVIYLPGNRVAMFDKYGYSASNQFQRDTIIVYNYSTKTYIDADTVFDTVFPLEEGTRIYSSDISPDSSTIVISGTEQNVPKIWMYRLNTQTNIYEYYEDEANDLRPNVTTLGVFSVNFSPNGEYLCAVTPESGNAIPNEYSIMLYQFEDISGEYKYLRTLSLGDEVINTDRWFSARCAWSPDSALLAISFYRGTKAIAVFDVTDSFTQLDLDFTIDYPEDSYCAHVKFDTELTGVRRHRLFATSLSWRLNEQEGEDVILIFNCDITTKKVTRLNTKELGVDIEGAINVAISPVILQNGNISISPDGKWLHFGYFPWYNVREYYFSRQIWRLLDNGQILLTTYDTFMDEFNSSTSLQTTLSALYYSPDSSIVFGVNASVGKSVEWAHKDTSYRDITLNINGLGDKDVVCLADGNIINDVPMLLSYRPSDDVLIVNNPQFTDKVDEVGDEVSKLADRVTTNEEGIADLVERMADAEAKIAEHELEINDIITRLKTPNSQLIVDPNYTGDEEYGTEEYPFKTLSKAVASWTFGKTILCLPGQVNEDVTLTDVHNMDIIAHNPIGQFRFKLNGSLILAGDCKSIGILGLEIANALNINCTNGPIYFTNCNFGSIVVGSPATAHYQRFDDCFIEHGITTQTITMDLRGCQKEDSTRTTISSGTLMIKDTDNISLSHAGGIVITRGDNTFISPDGGVTPAIVSNTNTGALFLDGGTTFNQATLSYYPISKTGTCPFFVSATTFFSGEDYTTWPGIRLGYQLSSKEVNDSNSHVWNTAHGYLSEHLTAISEWLQNSNTLYNELEARVTVNESNIAELQTDLSEVDNHLTDVETKVDQNTLDIADNKNSITVINGEVSDLQTAVNLINSRLLIYTTEV